MHREILNPVCLVLAPTIALVVAANAVENPPGNGPGHLQVVAAVGIASGLSGFAARCKGLSWPGTAAWAIASLAGMVVLIVLAALFVGLVIRPS